MSIHRSTRHMPRLALLFCTAAIMPSMAAAQQTDRPIISAGGTVGPAYGNISPFYGNISPFYGNISPFYGNISPFWGNISPFWGNISPFYGNISPFWGNISPFGGSAPTGAEIAKWDAMGGFWTDVGNRWSTLGTAWTGQGGTASPAALQGYAAGLTDIVDRSAAFWGAAVQAKTGKSFTQGFAAPMLAKYGIDLSKPNSLAGLTPEKRAQFFLDWYDGLMNFSGADRVDHWMKTANWNPNLTQVQGSGSDAVIGLVDFFVSADADIKSKVVYSGGYTVDLKHGAGVGSLMVASHDGRGVMGIAPAAKVAAYNPFDATGTASWDDVRKGIVEVGKRGAAVTNLSLGVAGWTFNPEWRDVFKESAVRNFKDQTLYVIAAGNDGLSQTTNVNMKDTFDNTFIVVGSVGADGTISNFSNRPGSACLTEDNKCENRLTGDDYFKKSGFLKNRFIVAPGELILVSDGSGGTVRASGTSYAAPLVSGAAALIHDRWPWLKKDPRAVASIILRSAKDLGAPGIDEVYGVGLLDIEASQSPLAFDELKYYLVDNGRQTEVSVRTLVSASATASSRSVWEVKGMYFSAFEKIDGAERDFLIPLSSRLVDTKAASGEYFQNYVYNQMVTWLQSDAAGSAGRGLSDLGNSAELLAAAGGWRMAVTGQVRNAQVARFGVGQATLRSTVSLTAPSGRLGFAIGQGAGAVVAGGTGGFGLTSDYDPNTGGANPLLGFASGGAHASAHGAILPGLKLSMGVTERRSDLRRETDLLGGALRNAGLLGLRAYAAQASNVRIDYAASPGVNVSAGWTRLNEDGAMLGVRSLEPSDFGGGSRTDGMTLGVDIAGPADFTLSVAANRSTTRLASGQARLRADNMVGSAYEVALAKANILGRGDFMRLSLAQPLTLEQGEISFGSVQIVDRQTGERGVVMQSAPFARQARRYVAEGHYGTSIIGGTGQVSLFARGELTGAQDALPALLLGFKGQLGF